MPVHTPINTAAGQQRRRSKSTKEMICSFVIFISAKSFLEFSTIHEGYLFTLKKLRCLSSLLRMPNAREIFQGKRGTTLAAKGAILGKQRTTGHVNSWYTRQRKASSLLQPVVFIKPMRWSQQLAAGLAAFHERRAKWYQGSHVPSIEQPDAMDWMPPSDSQSGDANHADGRYSAVPVWHIS